MRHTLRLELTIQFSSKWHSGSGESGLMLNRLINRDAQNRPYIPGSTLKGVVRESCEKLTRALGFPEPADPHSRDLTLNDNFNDPQHIASPVDRLFGTRYSGDCLFFRDARLAEDPPRDAVWNQSRICRYRVLGGARDKHLFSSEYAAPMTFGAAIDGFHDHLESIDPDDGEPPYAYCLLIAAILNVGRIGGDKSTGSGNLQIHLDAVRYNNKDLEAETAFEYLDSELYDLSRSAS